jgi:hypothetical protein
MKLEIAAKVLLLLFAVIGGGAAFETKKDESSDQHRVKDEQHVGVKDLSSKETHKKDPPSMESIFPVLKGMRASRVERKDGEWLDNKVAATPLNQGADSPPEEMLAVSHQRRELFLGGFFAAILDAIYAFLNFFDIFNLLPDPKEPTDPPTSAPTVFEPPEEGCDPETSFLVFDGHEQVWLENDHITYSPEKPLTNPLLPFSLFHVLTGVLLHGKRSHHQLEPSFCCRHYRYLPADHVVRRIHVFRLH